MNDEPLWSSGKRPLSVSFNFDSKSGVGHPERLKKKSGHPRNDLLHLTSWCILLPFCDLLHISIINEATHELKKRNKLKKLKYIAILPAAIPKGKIRVIIHCFDLRRSVKTNGIGPCRMSLSLVAMKPIKSTHTYLIWRRKYIIYRKRKESIYWQTLAWVWERTPLKKSSWFLLSDLNFW